MQVKILQQTARQIYCDVIQKNKQKKYYLIKCPIIPDLKNSPNAY
jgi:hypothetical protein